MPNQNEENCYVREQLGSIKSTIESVESKVDDLNKKLVDYSNRLRKVEDWKTSLVAIAAVLGSAITLTGKFLIDKIFGKSI